jgi:5-formyltetrahydrofolate cyclo-ligase
VSDPAAAKRDLRAEMAARRRAVPAVLRAAAGASVADHVLASPEFAAALRVAAYAALPDEIPTDVVRARLLATGRVLLLPRMEAGRKIAFAPVTGETALRSGRLGILEPPPTVPAARLGARDLVLVPGVAFDRSGVRLGRGGGWYDRSLPRGPGAPRIFGLAYAFQLIGSVPCESHDRRVDAVVTEEGIVRATPDARDPRADPG